MTAEITVFHDATIVVPVNYFLLIIYRRMMGVLLNMDTMTAEDLKDAIHEVLENPIYTENAQATRELMNDQMISPKEKFLYWIKYIIKHKGAKHLINNVAHEMSFVEFWCLDVYFLLLMSVILFIFILIRLMCCVFKIVCKPGDRGGAKTKAEWLVLWG